MIDVEQGPAIVLFHPAAVEPQFNDVGVPFGNVDYFVELLNHIVVVFGVLADVVNVGVTVAVPQRIVDAKPYAVFLAGFGCGFNHVGGVAARCHVVVGVFAVPQAEPVVVLHCEDDVFHAGVARCTHPLLGIDGAGAIVGGWLGAVGPFFVLKGVEPEVQKHAVAAFNQLELCFAGLVAWCGQNVFLPHHAAGNQECRNN